MSVTSDRNESAWLLPNDGTRTNHRPRRDMRRFADDGRGGHRHRRAGAGGVGAHAAAGARRVARRRRSTPDRSGTPTTTGSATKPGSHHLYWTEPRVIDGDDPIALGSNNSGRGVGGSMVHFAGYAPRFHPSDFSTYTVDGVGADWPITYADLAPYYRLIEEELPVAGQAWPWGDPHRYPHSPHPISGNGLICQRGALALGIEMRVGPVAITNGRFGNRPHCIYRGFCLQGCKVNAKASPLITHIPDALAHGAEVRADCMVSAIEVDDESGLADRRPLLQRRPRALPARPPRRRLRLRHRDTATAAQLGDETLAEWPGER